ncbi:hypothetical protein OAF47_00340 [bacterium]|nr:hypothetical protein [bacterium]
MAWYAGRCFKDGAEYWEIGGDTWPIQPIGVLDRNVVFLFCLIVKVLV